MELTRDQKREALELMRMDRDGDDWGTSMAHHFGIAHALYHAGADIPGEWEYRHGMGCQSEPDESEWPDAEYVFMTHSESGIAMLHYAGNVLNRYESLLERAGRSY